MKNRSHFACLLESPAFIKERVVSSIVVCVGEAPTHFHFIPCMSHFMNEEGRQGRKSSQWLAGWQSENCRFRVGG